VTHLRQIMLEELRRRNYAESTIRTYIRAVEHFSRYFHHPPDQLGPEHIREYQAALFTRWKLASNTVTQRLAALRFFYVQVLKRGWSVAETPYPKKVLHLPQVLSPEEVARLIVGGVSLSSHPADDALCHGCTPGRSRALEGQ
jgi:integrase/recombinase XerD